MQSLGLPCLTDSLTTYLPIYPVAPTMTTLLPLLLRARAGVDIIRGGAARRASTALAHSRRRARARKRDAKDAAAMVG